MKRFSSFAAAILAAAGLALAPTPSVAADGNDLAKILAGIAVAGIVAKAVDDRKDRKEAERVAEAKEFGRFGPARDGYRNDRRTIEGTVHPYYRHENRRGPIFGKNYKREPLPRQCLVRVETNRGDRVAYGARCLDQRYDYASRLPQSCETAVRTPRGIRVVYGARCLARDGWRVAGR